MKAIAILILMAVMAGCATQEPLDMLRGGKCQWVREKGDYTYTHYSKCDNPEHKEWKVYNKENKY